MDHLNQKRTVIKVPNRNETFYFLKVELGIDSCEEVAAIERLKHGPEYLWLWIRLALKYANYGGVLCRRIGDRVLPVTADDLEAEMKGGFTDVSIKDGVATLIQGSLIYINSDGFMAITGLTISGDPKEPTLHKQNSNTDVVRPLSIGNDTKSAVYQRERRKQLKEGDKKLQLPAPEKPMMSYADIAKKAGCIKQTVINHIKRLGWESHIVTMGQKKMVPESISRFLICKITGKNITPEIIEALRIDGLDTYHLDGLDGYHSPSKTIYLPSKEPSKTVYEPSKEGAENPHKQSELDGFIKRKPSETLDNNLPLFESKENKKLQEYIIETVQNRLRLDELYHVGFDQDPSTSELSLLIELLKKTDYSLLLHNLKITRKYHGENLAYTVACLQRCFESGLKSAADLSANEIIDPERNIDRVKQLIRENVKDRNNLGELETMCCYYAPLYSDSELIEAVRSAEIYQAYDPESFRLFIHLEPNGFEEIDMRMRQRQMTG